MQNRLNNLTRHAIEQMESRNIPELMVDFVLSYGDYKKSRDGGRKCAFSKASRHLIRRDLGKSALKELSKYRYFAPDGVHLVPAGVEAYVSEIKRYL